MANDPNIPNTSPTTSKVLGMFPKNKRSRTVWMADCMPTSALAGPAYPVDHA